MNGNHPDPGVADAYGRLPRATGGEVTVEQKRALRRAVAGIVAETRSYLPAEEYQVGSELSYDDGPSATVAVDPPAGYLVTAGYAPDLDDLEAGLDDPDRTAVAQELAASAVLQVMNAVDEITPTGR